jgi:hypothetical protein
MDAQEANGVPMNIKEAEQWLANEGFYDTGITKRVGQMTESYSFSSVLAAHSAQVEAELVEAKEAEKQMVCSYCGTVSVSDGTREDKVRMAFEHIEKCEKSPAKQMLDAMVRAEAAEAELVKLREQIVIRQKVIHFGQFHQWATYAICREKGCADTRKLVGEALGETVPETPSTTSRET